MSRKPRRRKLTRTQESILRLLCSGFSDKRIADWLKMPVGTVRTHLTRLRIFFRVDNRTGLAMSFLMYAPPPWFQHKNEDT
jgi:DNA-binding NarL/FixJ family response regulator